MVVSVVMPGKLNKVNTSPARPRRGVIITFACLVCCLWLIPGSATAQGIGGEDRWVTDAFEITMRSGKGSRQAIIRMLRSGTELELLESDLEAGYSLVRTAGGTEGWVLSRYLLKSPPARVTMPGVEVRLQASEDKRKELANELATLSKQHDQLKRQFDIVEASGQGLQKELAEVRRLSANAIKVDSQNKSLRVSLAEMQAQADKLQADNERLASRTNREWFVIGALVIIVGMLIGLTVPRIRWRKKSSWGDL